MNHNEEINSWAYRDILLNMILGLVMMLGILVLLISVKQQMESAQTQAPGNLIVNASWGPGDTDVDLWLMAPAEPVPIGYSNKSGLVWSLLRDDLGNLADATDLNYEAAYSRGVVPGSYTVNLQCYRCPTLPVKVNVEVSINKNAGDPTKESGSKTILTSEIEMTRDHQELTVVSFKMDANGDIDPASMNNVYRPLRAAGKQ